MTTQERYEKYNESIVPSEQLLQRTHELMLEAAQKSASDVNGTSAKETSAKKKNAHEKERGAFARLSETRGFRIFGRAMSYVAVAAASAIICVAVLESGLLQGRSGAVAADMEEVPMAAAAVDESAALGAASDASLESSSEETAESAQPQEEYADVTIYYVQGGALQSRVQNLSCSVETVFASWAEANGVSNVQVQGVTLEGEDASVMGVRIDFSQDLVSQLDAEGLMLQGLSMTMAQYLNADGVVLTAGGQEL